MSETKFTPSKWVWWTSNSWRRLRSDDGRTTREVLTPYASRSDGHPDIIVTEEDMALIAEAPNLYAALEAQVEVSRRMMVKAGFSEADIRDCTAQARTALQRARGETP